MSGDRPSGTVAFLFTDIEGSTRLWDEHADEMQAALARHDAILREVIDAYDGYIFSTGGDGFAAAFHTSSLAVDAAVEAQLRLAAEPIDSAVAIRVRMGIHAGTADERDGNYFGPALNLAARVMGCAWGGQIVASAVCASLSDRAALVTALGPVRLSGFAAPVDVCQITPGGQEVEFPPLRALDTVPNNLPRQRTPLVERENESRAIVDELDAWPLVTLTGVGGVGKTRLSLHVAEQCLPTFSDGVYFAELAPVVQDSDVIEALVDAIKPPLLAGRDTLSSLIEYLSSRRVLVVVDNCEHVIDSVADIVEQILADGSDTRILATSREGLGLAGERIRAIQPLRAGNPDAQGPAEELFTQRLAASEPDLQLDRDQSELVRQICTRLDGVPLALELAAARASTMSLTEILDRLEERFQLLRGGRRAVSERHQTLRNTVEWSYDLLDDDSKALFARLSVFAGSFDLDAVEQLCANTTEAVDVAEILGALVSKSMVEAIRRTDGSLRYRLLESLRQYAAEQLDASDDAAQWRERHAAVYGERVVRLGKQLHGPNEGAAMVDLLDQVPNTRAALLWAVERHRPDLAAQLTGPPGFQFSWHLTLTSLAASAIDVGAGSDPDWGHTVLISEIGSAYMTADLPRGRAALDDLRTLDVEGNPGLAATRDLGETFVAFMAGDFDRGIDSVTSALDRASDAGDEYLQLWSALVLTAFAAVHGQPRIETVDFAMGLARRLASPTTLAMALCTSALSYQKTDEARALDYADEAISLEIPPGGVCGLRHGIRGTILYRRQQWSDAALSLSLAVEEMARAGLSAEGSHFLALGAASVHQLGETEAGIDLFRASAAATDLQTIALYRELEAQAAEMIGEPFPPHRPDQPVPFDELARRAVRVFQGAAPLK